MPVTQVNKALVQRRFCRSLAGYDDHAVVQRELAVALCRRLAEQVGSGVDLGRVLELGCGTGLLTRALLERFSMQCWAGNDMVCACEGLADEVLQAGVSETQYWPGDMEACEFAAGWNLIVSSACFQWLSHPVAFVGRLHRLLVPGGLLAFSTFGPDNLAELAALTGQGLRYTTADAYRDALSAHWEVLVSHTWSHRLLFASPREVLRHLKATGTNAIAPRQWSRRELDAFSERYRERYQTEDGGVSLTYVPMLFVARFRGGEA